MLRILKHLMGVCLGLSLAACATTSAPPRVHPRLVELERLRQERGWTFEMKYTEVLERPLPRRIPLRTMSARQSPAPNKEPRGPLAPANQAPGAPWKPSSSPPSPGWTGSTTAACSSRSATSLPPRPRRATMPKQGHLPWRRDPSQSASGKPGAVQPARGQASAQRRGWCGTAGGA